MSKWKMCEYIVTWKWSVYCNEMGDWCNKSILKQKMYKKINTMSKNKNEALNKKIIKIRVYSISP